MNTEKIEKLLKLITDAGMIVIDDSPYLHGVDVEDTTGEPDNEVVHATWEDDDKEFSVIFTEQGLSDAAFEGNTIILEDHEGTLSSINLYDLTAVDINKMIDF